MEPLRETALLGTDKKALDLQHLPEPVRLALKEVEAPDSDLQFLEANSLFQFYELAGKMPSTFSGNIDETIIEEELTAAPKELMELYNRIESVDHQLKESALTLWLDVLIDNRQIISPDRLVELIDSGRNASNKTKAKIISVVGRKGRWILEHNDALAFTIAPTGDIIWSEGNMHDRRNMFTALRKTDPQSAITLLKSTWDTESIVNKKAFLELIRQTLVESDIPFLEELYTEFKHHAREKKTEKECRRLVVAMLLVHDSTTLFKSTKEQLTKYIVSPKKGIAGFVTGQTSGSFRIPDEEDEFWNAQVMEVAYGFEVKNYDIALYNNVQQFWLSYFLEYLPFSFWVSAFGSDYRKAVQFWLLDKIAISGQSVPIYLQTLIDNAVQLNDSELALALIHTQDAQSVLPLLRIVTPKDFEAFMVKNKYLDDVQLLSNGPFDQDQSWSLSFSEAVLKQAHELSEQNRASASLGKIIAQFVHHDSIDALYQINNKARESSAYYNWNTSIFQLVHPMLELRNKIHALKK